jgi:CRISPR locus-related DNA-binding protein
MSIHIAIIGRSPEPVLAGFHHYGSVEKLYLLHSPNAERDKFADIAKEVQRVLSMAGFTKVTLKEIDAFNMNSVINTILEVVELEKPPFFINITGGTNIMAAAACSAAFFVGAKAYYIQGKRGVENPENKVLELPVPNIPYYRTLSKSEMGVLRALSKMGGCCMNPQLKSALGISAQILSYHIGELEKKRLITVENNKSNNLGNLKDPPISDRRIKKIQLTNAGQLVLRWMD